MRGNFIVSEIYAYHKKRSDSEWEIVASKKNIDPSDLAYFKKIILEKRRDVLRSISATELINLEKWTHPNGAEIAQYSTHMVGQGTDAIQYEIDNYFVARSLKFLRHLNQALTRIEKGNYRTCINCNEEIPINHLEKVPNTRHCLGC